MKVFLKKELLAMVMANTKNITNQYVQCSWELECILHGTTSGNYHTESFYHLLVAYKCSIYE